MLKLLSCSLLLFACAGTGVYAQDWKPAMNGFHSRQLGASAYGFEVNFVSDGPLGRDWIVGGWYDSDSIRRCVAYRLGGSWHSLPFSGYYANVASDIEMYGDTLYIGGVFQEIVLDKDSVQLPSTFLLKWYDDSLWTSSKVNSSGPVYVVDDMSVKGDSLLVWGGSYYNPKDSSFTYTHFMTPDKGSSWMYPYSITHPTDTLANFGAIEKLKILPNGDILTINNGSNIGSVFRGICRWDGHQWHSYGSGLAGIFSKTYDFEFFEGNLYMGGTFDKMVYPQDPGNHIAKWNGSSWENVGGGTVGFVKDLFAHDTILYCNINGGLSTSHKFGDVAISYLAGWNGHQWCGTPASFGSAPVSFGIVNDTLFVAFKNPTTVNGDSVSYLSYFDGDYLHGPNAVCSTPGIGLKERVAEDELIQVHPNPAKDVLHINFPQNTERYSYELYSMDGRLLQQGALSSADIQIAVKEGVLGPCVLQIIGAQNVYSVKVLFEK